ncbi:MAG TPA: hypothetical protein VF804_05600 [Holophagaceae bacterium]
MVSLAHLWLPIILSAVIVFLASSVIHMVLKWHHTDYRQLPDEEALRAALHKAPAAPGQYVIPYCGDMKAMGTPEMQKKYADGPVAMLYLKAPGAPGMGAALGGWFAFNLVLSFFVAYVAGHTLAQGVHYLQVFRVVGTVGFLAYAAGSAPASIWMGKPWGVTLKEILDGMIYALLMAGTFGWLWPR